MSSDPTAKLHSRKAAAKPKKPSVQHGC
jgi:hypothetical protein